MMIAVGQLKDEAYQALDLAMSAISNGTLPSDWNDDGIGWQELWDHAQRAGVYASCDGIGLLDRATQCLGERSDWTALRTAVFHYHRQPVLDESCSSSTKLAETREECWTTTMYMARLLQALSSPFLQPKSTAVDRCISILTTAGERGRALERPV